MLSADHRSPAVDLLQPPDADYALDHAVLTTYSLDLEALLLLPMSLLRHGAQDPQELLDDPLLLLDKLGELTKRLTVFAEETAVRAPPHPRRLYGLLEDCVHTVRAPLEKTDTRGNGGASVHAKLWAVRFIGRTDPSRVLLRVAVPSRNLTFDRSWDAMWVGEARPSPEQKFPGVAPLADLVRALPSMTPDGLPQDQLYRVEQLATELRQCWFESPSGFSNPVRFFATGLDTPRRWLTKGVFQTRGESLLVVSPFIDADALGSLRTFVHDDTDTQAVTLVSRDDQIDAAAPLAGWSPKVLVDEAHRERGEERDNEFDGLHAKIIAIGAGSSTTWFLGSGNATRRAWFGRNVELMVRLVAPNSHDDRLDIPTFLHGKNSFGSLLRSYKPQPPSPEDRETHKDALEASRRREAVARQLLRAKLVVVGEASDDVWVLRVTGEFAAPDDVRISLRPVTSTPADTVLWSPEGVRFLLAGPAGVTAFFAFELESVGRRDKPLRLVLKLAANGFPTNRARHILRALIDSPEAFRRFLRALLTGIEDPSGLLGSGTGDGGFRRSGTVFDGMLEDLLRAASRHPARLDTLRTLVADLRGTEAGRRCLPPEFDAVWAVVDQAMEAAHG